MDGLTDNEIKNLIVAAFSERGAIACLTEEDLRSRAVQDDDSALFMIGALMAKTVENPQKYEDSCVALAELIGLCACDFENDPEVDNTTASTREFFSQLTKAERRAVVEWLRFVLPVLEPPVDELASRAICYWLQQDHDGPFETPS